MSNTVKREDFFDTKDTLYREHHREESEFLLKVLQKKGFKSCGVGNAESLWMEYSDSYAAGFLGMEEEEEEEVFECVRPYLYKTIRIYPEGIGEAELNTKP